MGRFSGFSLLLLLGFVPGVLSSPEARADEPYNSYIFLTVTGVAVAASSKGLAQVSVTGTVASPAPFGFTTGTTVTVTFYLGATNNPGDTTNQLCGDLAGEAATHRSSEVWHFIASGTQTFVKTTVDGSLTIQSQGTGTVTCVLQPPPTS